MSRLWQTLVSIWAWLVLVVCVLVWLPVMAVVRLVTARSDPGRYAVGYIFRQIPVVVAALNPLWRFRCTGTMPADPRRPYVVVSNHESFVDILLISHLPWEMKWLSKAELFRIPVLGWLMQAGGRHPGPARLRAERARGHRPVPRGARQPGLGDDLPRRHPFDDGRAAAVQGWRVPAGDRRRRSHPAAGVRGTGTALPKHDWRFGRSTRGGARARAGRDHRAHASTTFPRSRSACGELIVREPGPSCKRDAWHPGPR